MECETQNAHFDSDSKYSSIPNWYCEIMLRSFMLSTNETLLFIEFHIIFTLFHDEESFPRLRFKNFTFANSQIYLHFMHVTIELYTNTYIIYLDICNRKHKIGNNTMKI